jgi:hypothetical protein
MSKLFDNNCHSYARDNCYLVQEKLDDVLNRLNNLRYIHIFNGAASCAANVFGYISPAKGANSNRSVKNEKFFYLE